MLESLKLHQGPGLNGLFIPAAPLSCKYDVLSDTTTYILNKDFNLHMKGSPAKGSSIPPLKPETYKLLDILVCKLGDSRASCGVELTIDDFLQLAGYTVTEANKDAIRSRLKKNATLLGMLSMDWTEKGGRYSHQNVKLFDEISYGKSRVCACFSEGMASYLQGCATLSLPLALLAISGKSPHSYLLGRRCLVHNAANKGREWQPIRVGNLLAACPRIPRPEPEEKWSPSVLKRKVIAPFTAAMDSLADIHILSWKFREPVCRSDYESFADSVIEFRLVGDTTATLPGKSETVPVCNLFDYDAFLALR